MAKRIFVVALLAPMLALVKPAPAAAHVGVSFSIGLPFFGLVVDAPPFYGPPVYGPPVYARPAYVPVPVYGPPAFYVQPRAFFRVPPGYRPHAFHRPPPFGHHFRRW